jgi:hypothetical protein
MKVLVSSFFCVVLQRSKKALELENIITKKMSEENTTTITVLSEEDTLNQCILNGIATIEISNDITSYYDFLVAAFDTPSKITRKVSTNRYYTSTEYEMEFVNNKTIPVLVGRGTMYVTRVIYTNGCASCYGYLLFKDSIRIDLYLSIVLDEYRPPIELTALNAPLEIITSDPIEDIKQFMRFMGTQGDNTYEPAYESAFSINVYGFDTEIVSVLRAHAEKYMKEHDGVMKLLIYPVWSQYSYSLFESKHIIHFPEDFVISLGSLGLSQIIAASRRIEARADLPILENIKGKFTVSIEDDINLDVRSEEYCHLSFLRKVWIAFQQDPKILDGIQCIESTSTYGTIKGVLNYHQVNNDPLSINISSSPALTLFVELQEIYLSSCNVRQYIRFEFSGGNQYPACHLSMQIDLSHLALLMNNDDYLNLKLRQPFKMQHDSYTISTLLEAWNTSLKNYPEIETEAIDTITEMVLNLKQHSLIIGGIFNSTAKHAHKQFYIEIQYKGPVGWIQIENKNKMFLTFINAIHTMSLVNSFQDISIQPN